MVGPVAAELSSLSKSPTSRAAVGILRERAAFRTDEVGSTGNIELHRCHDSAIEGNPLPSPFAVVCLNTLRISSEAEAQSTCVELEGLLRVEDLHRNPVIVLVNGDDTLVAPSLRFSATSFTVLDSVELLKVLLSRPPRQALMHRIRARAPISLLNPYIYRGPVHENLFRGRERELTKLTALQTSYALIGPRAIGKTSLMNRAVERLRKQGAFAVNVEYSEATGEQGLCDQIIEGFIRHFGASEGLRTKISPQRVQRLIQDYVMRGSPRRVVLLVDEADLLNERCPELTSIFRLCHNNGWAKFVFLGFKKLKRAVSDRTNSVMANFAEELPLGGLELGECGSLITQPMGELGIQLSNIEEVVKAIYHETAGSPSRI